MLSGPSSTGRKGPSSVFQGAGHSLMPDGGSHPQDVSKVSGVAMGIVTHCFTSSQMLKSCSMRGSDIAVGCLPAWGGPLLPHTSPVLGDPLSCRGLVAPLRAPGSRGLPSFVSCLPHALCPLSCGVSPVGLQLPRHPPGFCRQLRGGGGTSTKLWPASKVNLFTFIE